MKNLLKKKLTYNWTKAFLIFVSIIGITTFAQSQNEVYCNERFDFCLQYPSEIFKEKIISANNDGIELRADENRMIVKVSGIYNVLNNTIEEEYELFIKYMAHDKPGFEIYSVKTEPNQFIAYAYSENEVYFQKTISTGSHLIILSILSRMPTLEQSKMAIDNIENELIFLVYP